jgi:hypothetical protein
LSVEGVGLTTGGFNGEELGKEEEHGFPPIQEKSPFGHVI